MKASIDDDGYLKLDAQTFVQSLPDKVLRDLAKYALFDELVIKGIIGALVDGLMWDEDGEQPWWFASETFTRLRLQLLPLLPDVTAEAVRHMEVEAKRAKTEANRWHDAAWKLWHAFPDHSTRPEHPTWAYEHHATMTKEQAAEHLRAVEAKLAAERSELEQLRAEVGELRAKQSAFGEASHG